MSLVINNLRKAKRTSSNGFEYWLARDIQKILGYSKWSNFQQAIKRAKQSCSSGGRDSQNHFADLGNMVLIGSDTERAVKDFALSRYACYLIAMATLIN